MTKKNMIKPNSEKEIEIEKKIAYTAGLLQGDVTIKTLIESLAEGVVIINEYGRIVLINKRMTELTGYSKDEIMGKNLNIIIPEIFHHKHDAHINDYFSNPRIRPMGTELDLKAKKKDMTTFPVEISLSFLNTESGMLGLAFLTDISSRKKAEEDLKRRNKELDSYAHTVAHDLNSSLTGIVGFSEILIDPDKKLSKKTRDSYLKEIALSGRKMSSIIREILIFASMKKEDLVFSKVNIKEIIDSAVKRLKFQIKESSAHIKIENIIDCNCYSPWMEEIWFNLISNAIKYGGNPPVIQINCESDADYIKYSVKDNGMGVDDDLKDIMFDENVKGKDHFSKGFGLGLSIVKRITEKLDGYITVDSEPGKGSVFSFYLKK